MPLSHPDEPEASPSSPAQAKGSSPGETAKPRGIVLAAGKGSRMMSDLPKVLHEIHGKPMIQYSLELMAAVGVERTVVVVGYKSELIRERLKEQAGNVRFAFQDEQKGTGHAVMQAEPHLQGFDGHVFITYGDMPLLKARHLRQLASAGGSGRPAGALLTLTMDHPPEWGRILRDPSGRVTRIVEAHDASPKILALNEVNVGVYYFHAPRLFSALRRIGSSNAQGEYYLTDVVEVLAQAGEEIKTVPVENLDDALGVNEPSQLGYAEKLSDIEYAQKLYGLIDAMAGMRKGARRGR